MQDQLACGLDSAHHLDDNVGAFDKPARVGGQQRGIDTLARRAHVAHGDADDVEARTHARPEVVCLVGQEPDDLRPHNSASQKSYAKRPLWCRHETTTFHRTCVRPVSGHLNDCVTRPWFQAGDTRSCPVGARAGAPSQDTARFAWPSGPFLADVRC